MQKVAGIRRSQSEPSDKGAKQNALFGAPFRRAQSLYTNERLEILDLTTSSSSLRAKMKAEGKEVEEMTQSFQEVQKYLKVSLSLLNLSGCTNTMVTVRVCVPAASRNWGAFWIGTTRLNCRRRNGST